MKFFDIHVKPIFYTRGTPKVYQGIANEKARVFHGLELGTPKKVLGWTLEWNMEFQG